MATAFEVKKYLQAEIQKLRSQQGLSWPAIQKKLGPYAWAVWLMVEKEPAPSPTPSSARRAEIHSAHMEVR